MKLKTTILTFALAFMFIAPTANAGASLVTVEQVSSSAVYLQSDLNHQLLLSVNLEPSFQSENLKKVVISCDPYEGINEMILKIDGVQINQTSDVGSSTYLYANGYEIHPYTQTNVSIYGNTDPDLISQPAACYLTEVAFEGLGSDEVDLKVEDKKTKDERINRADLMKKLVLGVSEDPDPTIYNNCFTDAHTQWYARYACYAKWNDWVTGYDDGSFLPYNYVTKAEAVKMIMEAYELPVPNYAYGYPFEDIDPYSWYGPYVVYADEYNLLPDTDIDFHPGEYATHEYVGQVIANTLALVEQYSIEKTHTVGNISITYTGFYEIETDESMPGAFMLQSSANDGVAVFPLDEFEELMAELGEDYETFLQYFDGSNVEISVAQGDVSNYFEFNSYNMSDEYATSSVDPFAIIFQVDPEDGSGQSYLVLGIYSQSGSQDSMLEIIESIEVI